jgi:hypothetical protein
MCPSHSTDIFLCSDPEYGDYDDYYYPFDFPLNASTSESGNQKPVSIRNEDCFRPELLK